MDYLGALFALCLGIFFYRLGDLDDELRPVHGTSQGRAAGPAGTPPRPRRSGRLSAARHPGRERPVQVMLESSCVTPWVGRLLGEMGHQVVVLNPRRLIAESALKSDTVDAEILARLSRFDLTLLRPVYQRSEAAQEMRTRLRVRGSLVNARTALIKPVRGSLRSQGYRMGSCPTRSFVARWFELRLASGLREVLEPLLETIAELTDRIDLPRAGPWARP